MKLFEIILLLIKCLSGLDLQELVSGKNAGLNYGSDVLRNIESHCLAVCIDFQWILTMAVILGQWLHLLKIYSVKILKNISNKYIVK